MTDEAPGQATPMTAPSAPHSRRIDRLAYYFLSYPYLRISISDVLEEPLRLSPCGRKGKRAYHVEVSDLVLTEDSPEWVESSILRCAKSFVQKLERAKPVPYSIYQEYTDLQTLFAERFEQKTTPREETISLKPEPLAYPGDLGQLWQNIRLEYFPDRPDLDCYQVRWSNRRQRSCLASCNAERRRVEVAQALNHAECHLYLEPLLYHEMCHAALGKPPVVNGRRVMHGKDFKALEKRHPRIPALDEWIKKGGWERAVRRLSQAA